MAVASYGQPIEVVWLEYPSVTQQVLGGAQGQHQGHQHHTTAPSLWHHLQQHQTVTAVASSVFFSVVLMVVAASCNKKRRPRPRPEPKPCEKLSPIARIMAADEVLSPIIEIEAAQIRREATNPPYGG